MDKYDAFLKLQLSKDLVMFIMNVMLIELTPAKKAEKAEQILQAWEGRVEAQLKNLHDEHLDLMFEHTRFITFNGINVEKDEMRIIADIHALGPAAIRQEFAGEIRDTVLKNLVQ
jgi:hypothetical protein